MQNSLPRDGRKRDDDVDETLGTWTALEASKAMYDESFYTKARRSISRSLAVAAVAGPGSRSRGAKKSCRENWRLEETEKACQKGNGCW